MENTQRLITIDPAKAYTKSEYFRVFKVSRPTIDNHIAKGKLKAVEVQGTILILVEDKL